MEISGGRQGASSKAQDECALRGGSVINAYCLAGFVCPLKVRRQSWSLCRGWMGQVPMRMITAGCVMHRGVGWGFTSFIVLKSSALPKWAGLVYQDWRRALLPE